MIDAAEVARRVVDELRSRGRLLGDERDHEHDATIIARIIKEAQK
jgi:hypothetical protein